MKYRPRNIIIVVILGILSYLFVIPYLNERRNRNSHEISFKKGESFGGIVVGIKELEYGHKIIYLNKVNNELFFNPSDSTKNYYYLINNGKADILIRYFEPKIQIGDSIHIDVINNKIYTVKDERIKDSIIIYPKSLEEYNEYLRVIDAQ